MPFSVPVQYQPTGETRNGRPLYVVTRPFSYFCRDYPPIFVPIGYVTDLASIPVTMFWLKPNNPKWDAAAIVHDKACRLVGRIGTKITQTQADALLYYAMLDLGASKVMAFGFWTWVRNFHGWSK